MKAYQCSQCERLEDIGDYCHCSIGIDIRPNFRKKGDEKLCKENFKPLSKQKQWHGKFSWEDGEYLIEKETVLNGFQLLIEQAVAGKLWLYRPYQELWLSPKEFKDFCSTGNFVGGATNWELRSPFENLKTLEEKKTTIIDEIKDFRKRVYVWRDEE